MALPYNGTIPQATDQLSVSQGQILNNFGSIQTLIDQNHTDFTALIPGQHDFVEFPQGVPTQNTMTANPELAVYCNTFNGNPELFLQRYNLAANSGNPFTAKLNNAFGWSTFASGVVMAWGTYTVTLLGARTITFAAACPAFTPFAATLTYFNAAAADAPVPNFRLQGFVAGGVNIWVSDSYLSGAFPVALPYTINFIALGVAFP